jgi:hypothetical protein
MRNRRLFDQRSTRENEELARIAEAAAKARATYCTARNLLIEAGNEPLLAELDALALALEQLAALAASRKNLRPADSDAFIR